MKKTELSETNKNRLIALLYTLLLGILAGAFFDFYFALNDDMLMKDVIAGIYTGTPSGMNKQMLYPLSLCLSLLYSLCRSIPWYSLFYLLCQFGCIYLITARLLNMCSKTLWKPVILLFETLTVITLFLTEYIFIQYTVTAALLAATAAFLFYTAPPADTIGAFIKLHAVSILLVILAYQLRTEMLLLMLPFICVTGLCSWCREAQVFTVRNFQKYLSLFGLILAGLAVSSGINGIAYSQTNWPEYNRLFDNRTNLYDFQTIPLYEEHRDFYDSIGLSQSQYNLLINYDYGMDDQIDSNVLGQIADYAATLKETTSPSPVVRIKQAILELRYRLLFSDRLYSFFLFWLYPAVLILAVLNRHLKLLWELPFLAVVRTGLWVFILYRGRSPERITHSLYFMELILLTALLLRELAEIRTLSLRRSVTALAAVLLLLGFILYLPTSVSETRTEYKAREDRNRAYLALQEYTGAHPDNFYLWDVYSSVPYSEKLFADSRNQLSNLDIMGGWLNKSPLTDEKFSHYGISSMEQAVLQNDSVYIVVKIPQVDGLPHFEDWITSYYKEKGISIRVLTADTIKSEGSSVFQIYQITQ